MDKEKLIRMVTNKYYRLLFLYEYSLDKKEKDKHFYEDALFMEGYEASIELLKDEERLFIMNDFNYTPDVYWYTSIMDKEEYIIKRHQAMNRFLTLLIYTGVVEVNKKNNEEIY